MTTPEVEKRAEQYFVKRNLAVDSCLGVGTQGSVFVCSFPSRSGATREQFAVKFHEREIAYRRELAAYQRLRDLGINDVAGLIIPDLIGYDDELLAIEMTIVSPPFCLDFGGAYLDRPPDYSPEVWRDWEEMKSMAFEENWSKVKQILRHLENYGIYVADVNPGNIKFE